MTDREPSTLEKILSETETSEYLEQIREICNKIWDEEKSKVRHPGKLPKGPNIFISLEVPGRRENEYSYISLEREAEDRWLTVYRTIFTKDYTNKDKFAKRVKVFEIRQFKPNKVLSEFAKHVKLLRGE